MANVGDKYIIEIDRKLVGFDLVSGNPNGKAAELYRIKGFNSLVFDENGLRKLERFDPDAKANADYDAGYREGMHETWEAAKKLALIEELGGMTPSEIMEAFGMSAGRVFAEMDPADVIEKLNQYEREKEREEAQIHVGDEVKSADGTWIVTWTKDGFCLGFDSDGNIHGYNEKGLIKTGRSFLGLIVALENMKEADAPLPNS